MVELSVSAWSWRRRARAWSFAGPLLRRPSEISTRLIYWNEVGKGGHFAAWEQPVPFTAKVRAASRSLRELDGEGGGHNVRRPSPGSASLP